MCRQVKRGKVLPKANRSFGHVLRPVWPVVILLLTATLQVIERIEAKAPETAEGLRILVQDFQMGLIRELLGEVKREKME
jgi:hypothetical protein